MTAKGLTPKRGWAVAIPLLMAIAASGSAPTPDAAARSLPLSAAAAPALETPLATVGSQVIREADFQRYLSEHHSAEDVAAINQTASERTRALQRYLDSVAVVAKARHAGIDRETRFQKAAELMEVKLLSQLVTERYRDQIVRHSQVTEEEVRRHYERRQHELTEQPRFTAHQLLVYVKGNPAFPDRGRGDAEARARAEHALAELRAGKSWDAVVRTYSDDVARSRQAGLIRNGRFGYFAAEVERAVRTQALGVPGEVIRTVFGYHVVQVEDRITERVPRPFAEVREMLREQLARERSEAARQSFMSPIRDEVGVAVTQAGGRDVFLLDEQAIAPDEILAEVGGRPILESDFRWFLQDALIPEQRTSAYSRPGARQSMLTSFLDMLVLATKARREGLHESENFIRRRAAMERKLLTEFMQHRDQAGPFCRCGDSAEQRQRADREYFDRVRAEVGLEVVAQGA